MVGGAPISQAYCHQIGADAFSDSASGAAVLAKEIASGDKQYAAQGEKALAGIAKGGK